VNSRKSNGTHKFLDLNEICVEEGIGETNTIPQFQRGLTDRIDLLGSVSAQIEGVSNIIDTCDATIIRNGVNNIQHTNPDAEQGSLRDSSTSSGS
jgi:hypothetical protein